MKTRPFSSLFIVFVMVCLTAGSALANDTTVFKLLSHESALGAPTLTLMTCDTTVTASWTSVSGATGYTLLYAPYPYTGPETIQSVDMETQRSIVVNLPVGAAYYVAVQAYSNDRESELSNIESFTIYDTDIVKRIDTHSYPKLFIQIQSYVEGQVYNEAAEWDIIILDPAATEFAPSYLGRSGIIRSINPNAVILMYFSASDVNIPWNKILENFMSGMKVTWYMRDDQGKIYPLFSIPPNYWTDMLNLTTDVNVYMPEFINNEILSLGMTDGIFFDWISDQMSWLNNRTDGAACGPIDIDNDGIADSSSKIDNLWVQGTKTLISNARDKFPKGHIIVGNGGWVFDGTYANSGLNGRMVEVFLEGESQGFTGLGWLEVMRGYYLMQAGSVCPKIPLIMTNGTQDNFKHMRFGLTSTLLFDGYSTYSNYSNLSNPSGYIATWWYDEYSVDISTGKSIKSMKYKGYLGSPISEAYNANDSNERLSTLLVNNDLETLKKVWRRDFKNGIVVVNPSSSDVAVDLRGTYKKIIGIYDPAFNNGSSLTNITMEAKSGVILLN